MCVVITKSIYQTIRLNFKRKSCLLKCWSLFTVIKGYPRVHIVKCKVIVSFVPTYKI